MNNYKCESVRLCRFLYSLGFDKKSETDENNKEYWIFERSQDLQKSLDFFFFLHIIYFFVIVELTYIKENYIYHFLMLVVIIFF